MSIAIAFITNTNYEIQIWIIKTCCKFYIHKIKDKKILKTYKIKEFKMLKPKRKIKPLYGKNIYPS
jgi:hypothetical protein